VTVSSVKSPCTIEYFLPSAMDILVRTIDRQRGALPHEARHTSADRRSVACTRRPCLVRTAHVTAVGACTGASERPIVSDHAEKNRAAFRKIVKSGPPPGLLAFDGDVAVGWCSSYRAVPLPWLDHEWRLKRLDEVQCGPYLLLCADRLPQAWRHIRTNRSGSKSSRRRKGSATRAYPLDAAKTPSASGTGYASTFARAGFKIVACHFPPRPIMRHELRPSRDLRLIIDHRPSWRPLGFNSARPRLAHRGAACAELKLQSVLKSLEPQLHADFSHRSTSARFALQPTARVGRSTSRPRGKKLSYSSARAGATPRAEGSPLTGEFKLRTTNCVSSNARWI